MTIEEQVKEALMNAREGGYSSIIDTMTDEDLTDDLMNYCSDLCDYPRTTILDCVSRIRSDEYREKNRLGWFCRQ